MALAFGILKFIFSIFGIAVLLLLYLLLRKEIKKWTASIRKLFRGESHR